MFEPDAWQPILWLVTFAQGSVTLERQSGQNNSADYTVKKLLLPQGLLFSLGFTVRNRQIFFVCLCYNASFGISPSWHGAWFLLAIYSVFFHFTTKKCIRFPSKGLPACLKTNACISACCYFHILNWIPDVFYDSASHVWLHRQNQELWPTLSGSACEISPGYFTHGPDQSESNCLRLFMGQSGQVWGPIIHPKQYSSSPFIKQPMSVYQMPSTDFHSPILQQEPN